eukprot:scaffold166852_cov32-Tisochrysis_lutea.AAC.4
MAMRRRKIEMQEGGEEERVREGCCLFVVICMYAQNVEQAPSIAVIEISLHLVHPWAMGGHVPPPPSPLLPRN